MSTFGSRLQREPFFERHHFLAFVIAAAAGLGLTTLSVKQPESTRRFQQLGLLILGPMANAGSSVSGTAGDAWGGLSSTWKARKELAVLQEEVAGLRLVSSERDQLAEENVRLREMLDLQARVPLKTVPARIIYQERGPDWVLLIDRGSEAGIRADQAVIAPEGVVGKVLSVSEGLSRVQCVVDGDAGVAVRIGPAGRQADAVVTDGSGDRCRLRHVDLIEDVQPGDAVVTSGLDLIYPSGLLVGTVESAEAPGVEREIVVRPAVDFDKLAHVLVIVSGDDAAGKAHLALAAGSERSTRKGR